ncbi:fibrobacter succinogenes major paralogous domain-containing protein [Echinicola sp. CAU 1574]|uniref:Fibrobacter succinogenes major paralogous domain-containing protein n=1 Tax=Echinicola arenosa TaxID=2774144 RepID=A0ABR9ANN8_9BACT|nr:fibrobacter succinogenes major paralogous domain-containing protein [Echinicola arenosa]MBD8489483.1 fibrobacter succinogenes major paralogous domain-containing protein [Echinicola arenosa]
MNKPILLALPIYLFTKWVSKETEDFKLGVNSFMADIVAHFYSTYRFILKAIFFAWKSSFSKTITMHIADKTSVQKYPLRYNLNNFTKTCGFKHPNKKQNIFWKGTSLDLKGSCYSLNKNLKIHITATPMKNSIYYLSLLFLLATGCVQENLEAPKMGMVSFSEVTFEHFGNISPKGRIAADSEWKHILTTFATMLITNKATGQEYTLEYNPSDFTEAYQIQLPYGEYTVYSRVEGLDYASFMPFTISGEFTLDETSLDISLQGSTEYGLVTVKNEFVQSANLRGDQYGMQISDDGEVLYLYVKAGLSPTLTIYENFNGQAFQKKLDIVANNHYHFYLKLTEVQGTVNFIELAIGPFEYHEGFLEIGETSCNSERYDYVYDIAYLYDIEGNRYPIVEIGDQVWMSRDLRTKTYANGDPIINEGNNTSNLGYTWYSAVDNRNICPCNWHVPSNEDWLKLERFLGLPEDEEGIGLPGVRGKDERIGAKLANPGQWYYRTEYYYYFTNETGFFANSNVQSGMDAFYLSTDIEISKTDPEEDGVLVRNISHRAVGIGLFGAQTDDQRNFGKGSLVGVRCVKD